MLNQVILIGKLIQTYSEKNQRYITLRIMSPPNTTDDYDIIHCLVSDALVDYDDLFIVGSIIGVKGKVKSHLEHGYLTIEVLNATIIKRKEKDHE